MQLAGDEEFTFHRQKSAGCRSKKINKRVLAQVKMATSASCSQEQQPAGQKRKDTIDWTEYFMAMAFLAAKRSKDPSTQVGACIVNEEKRVVGIGYNGFPTGCSDDEFPWSKASINPLETKYLYVCHAEVNAILNKNSTDVKNCTMYVALFPCNECAKIIIQSSIREVVYMSDKHAHKEHTIAAKRMFDAAGVKYTHYKPPHSQIVIDFTEIDWDSLNQVPATPQKDDATTTTTEVVVSRVEKLSLG